jgi:hypothetical protein
MPSWRQQTSLKIRGQWINHLYLEVENGEVINGPGSARPVSNYPADDSGTPNCDREIIGGGVRVPESEVHRIIETGYTPRIDLAG